MKKPRVVFDLPMPPMLGAQLLPQKLADGRWRVGDQVFETNAQAWRWIDRQSNEPVSRSEDTGDWAFNKMVSDKYG